MAEVTDSPVDWVAEHTQRYLDSGGEDGHEWRPGVPTLLLTTTGRKSGQKRTSPLIYQPYGNDYLVVASKGGDPKAPGWYHNLKANPSVEINVGPKRFGVTAKPVTPDDPDYPRLWQIVNNMRGNKDRYIGYQNRTSRPIPKSRAAFWWSMTRLETASCCAIYSSSRVIRSSRRRADRKRSTSSRRSRRISCSST